MNHSLRSLLSTTCLTAFAVWGFMGNAQANPENGVVSAGQASISSNGKTLNVYQQSQKAVIDWRSFDINPDETTSFYQPNSNSVTLNRVHSGSASHINGNLTANGNVVIVNQNGIVFGAGSKVDVHGLVASTADIDNDHFMNNDKAYFNKAGQADASIINNGSITAKDAGLVGFVAPNVENNGVITAKMGRVHLASGSTATVDFYGDGLMEVQVGDDVKSQTVSNRGSINADGGVVALTAAAGGKIVNSLISSSGSITAQSIGQKNGQIIISAAGSNAVAGNVTADKGKKQGKSKVVISGSLDTSGKNSGETGGKIVVTGDEVVLNNTSSLDASGYLGGGVINLGGDYQGSGDTPNALLLTVNKGAVIDNRSIYSGNGGRTILWSDGETIFEGKIIATGGSQSGDGGFAEVSGHDALNYNGFADLSAAHGAFGTLLLDPTDITISNAASSSIGYAGGTYTGTGATSNLNVGVLQTQLASASVIVNTASSYLGNGDITVADAIVWSSNNNLTFIANRDIFINASIKSNGASTITATASRNLTYNAAISTTGAGGIVGTATNNLTVAAGAVLTSGATGLTNLRAAGGVITNTGLLTLDGRINAGTGALTLISGLNGTVRNNLTLDNTTFSMQGASVGATSLTGFYDVNFNKAFTSSGAVTATAFNDLNVNGALTGGNNSAIALTATRDLSLNSNVTAVGSGSVTGLATRHLTVGTGATVSSGATGGISLRSAGGVVTNTGLLTLNGAVNAGAGVLTLSSGLNGTVRNNLTLNNATFLMQGASIGAVSLTGFYDINFDKALTTSSTVTATAYNDMNINAAMTSGTNSGFSLTALHDLTFNANVTAAGTGSVAGLATNNLTVASGATIASGATGGINLRAANGSATNTGLLTLNGRISNGSNALTLLSGLNGTNRNNLTLDSASFLMQGANVAGISLTGFNDINVNSALVSTASFTAMAYRDLNFNSNLTLVGAGSISGTANNNLTVASGATLTSGATGGINLRAAGGSIANTGLLTLGGKLITGTSTFGFTLLSGLSGTNRSDLVLDSNSYGQQNTGSHAVNITGFRDVTLNTDISANNGAMQVIAQRNLTVGSGVTLKTNTGYITTLRAAGGSNASVGVLSFGGIMYLTNNSGMIFSSGLDASGNRSDITLDSSNYVQEGSTISSFQLTGFRDITLNHDIISNQPLTAIAQRDLTIGSGVTVQGGAASAMTLQAAGGVINNTGVFNMNGKIIVGTGALTLTSGLNTSGGRSDLNINATTYSQGATVGAVTVTGFRDINLDTSVTSGNGSINFTAERNLNIGSNAIFQTNSGYTTTLRAAGGSSINNVGLLTFNGKVNLTLNSALTMFSGVDASGNRADLTFDYANYLMAGATTNGLNLSGFRDINLNRNILIATQPIAITAQRNLTIASGVTVQSGSGSNTTLQAAGGGTGNTGTFTLNGKIIVGGGSLNIVSGRDASGNSTDLTLNSSNYSQPTTIASLNLGGFRDVVLNTDLKTTAGIYITADRNLTVGAGSLVSAGGELQLRAAGNNTARLGVLNLNGKIFAGTGNILIASGVDASGNRTNLTFDSSSYSQGANIGQLNIAGFNDVNLNTNITSNAVAGISVVAQRHLTIGTGATVKSASNLFLQAAGGVITNTGLFTLNGVVSAGYGGFNMVSGVNGTTRSDLLLDASHFSQVGAVNGIAILGFRDVTIDTNVASQNSVSITAQRNLHITSGGTIQGGGTSFMTLRAAGGVYTNTGLFTLDGKLSLAGTTLTLASGLDASGHQADITLNGGNLIFQQPAMGALGIDGFRDVTLDASINSSTNVFAKASRDLIIGSNGHIQTAAVTTLVAGRNFINYGGTSALSPTGSGRWVVYSTDPRYDSAGNMPYKFKLFSCTYGGGCALPTTGNGFVYSNFDYEGISATIPDTVIKVNPPVVPVHTSTPVTYSSEDGAVQVLSVDEPDNNYSGPNAKTVLIIEPELAKRFSLEDWSF